MRTYHVLPYTHFIVSVFVLWASLYSNGDNSESLLLPVATENPTAGAGDNTGFILSQNGLCCSSKKKKKEKRPLFWAIGNQEADTNKTTPVTV